MNDNYSTKLDNAYLKRKIDILKTIYSSRKNEQNFVPDKDRSSVILCKSLKNGELKKSKYNAWLKGFAENNLLEVDKIVHFVKRVVKRGKLHPAVCNATTITRVFQEAGHYAIRVVYLNSATVLKSSERAFTRGSVVMQIVQVFELLNVFIE